MMMDAARSTLNCTKLVFYRESIHSTIAKEMSSTQVTMVMSQRRRKLTITVSLISLCICFIDVVKFLKISRLAATSSSEIALLASLNSRSRWELIRSTVSNRIWVSQLRTLASASAGRACSGSCCDSPRTPRT